MRKFILPLLLFVAALCIADPLFHDVRPGYGVTSIKWLSDYIPSLKRTPGDTRVYVMEGEKPGANVLLLGGTHTNEIAGVMAAIMFVERATITQGTLYVIPWANNSAASWQGGSNYESSETETSPPQFITFETRSGPRSVVVGDRRTNPSHQVTDPATYVHISGVEFPGFEARNLNRVHPGKPDGTLTEKISYGLFQLVKTEGIDMVLDMHEAGTKSRLSNTLVCNPKNIDMGAMAVLDMEALGINFKLEQSSDEFRGLSHKEFGDLTDALAFLSETPNPAQDRGKTDPDTADNPEFRLDRRVAVQVYTFLTLCNYLEMFTNKAIVIENMPDFDEIQNDLFRCYN